MHGLVDEVVFHRSSFIISEVSSNLIDLVILSVLQRVGRQRAKEDPNQEKLSSALGLSS